MYQVLSSAQPKRAFHHHSFDGFVFAWWRCSDPLLREFPRTLSPIPRILFSRHAPVFTVPLTLPPSTRCTVIFFLQNVPPKTSSDTRRLSISDFCLPPPLLLFHAIVPIGLSQTQDLEILRGPPLSCFPVLHRLSMIRAGRSVLCRFVSCSRRTSSYQRDIPSIFVH